MPDKIKEAAMTFENRDFEFEYTDEFGFSHSDFSNDSTIKLKKKELDEMSSIEQQLFLATTMSKWVIKETI